MPELPEIETIRRLLSRGWGGQLGIIGEQITQAGVLWPRTLATPSRPEFDQQIKGRRILDITRRGKFLIFKLDQGYLIFHLRMSGDLLLEEAISDLAPHHRLVLYFGSDRRLAFNDTRKFGRVWLVNDPHEVTGRLGPEPFDPQLDTQAFFERLYKHRRKLKPLLMDQSFLAGMGNIYTDEALHRAKINPLMLSNLVTLEQAGTLLSSLRFTLEAGIQHNGSSIDWVYRGGEFQNYFRVYDRKGQPCPECGTLIERIVVGQRGTHYCPTCQPLRREG